MSKAARCTAALLSIALAGCGGGSGSSPTATSVNFALDANSVSDTLAAGDELNLRVTGRWTSDDAKLTSVYLQVQDPGGSFTLPATMASSGAIALDLPVSSSLAAGKHDAELTLRACRDAQCASPLPGTATLAYHLTVQPVDDWLTHQGNNAHRGAVPIRLNPSRFKQAWSWKRPASSEPIGGINPVVTYQGKVLLTTDVYFGEGRLYALDELDGHEVWMRSVGSVPAFNPPAIGGGKVYAAVTGHSDTFLYAFDLRDGAILHRSAFDGQWPHFLAPTVDGDMVFQGGGYYGGSVYGFSTQDGSRLWTTSVGGAWDMFSVAADGQYVYHHDGAALHILARATGAAVADIPDSLGSSSGGSYHGGPVIGTQGMVMSFVKEAFSGRASASAEQYDQRLISAFDISSRKYAWTSNRAYQTVPAAADGVLYVARNDPAALDAIDERTGNTLWSFALPTQHGSSFHRNIVVTRTLLFCSTDTEVLAIDLATRNIAWSQPTPGMLALSAGRTLYIATGARESDGGLIAVRLH